MPKAKHDDRTHDENGNNQAYNWQKEHHNFAATAE